MVRRFLIAGSIFALSLPLVACDIVTTKNNATSAGQAEWTDGNLRQLREAIDRRAQHGLDHLTFEAKGEGPDAQTDLALRYAAALAYGASDPTKVYDIYTVPRPKLDLRAGLTKAMAVGAGCILPKSAE